MSKCHLSELPDIIRLQDPFDEKNDTFLDFKVREVQSDSMGMVLKNDVYLKTIKMFIAREIRPRFCKWFENLSNFDMNKADEVSMIPRKIEIVIESAANRLAPEIVDEIKKATPMCLFSEAERKFIIPQLVSFLCSAFRSFEKTNLFKRTQMHPLSKKIKRLNIPSSSDEKKNQQQYESIVKFMDIMFTSWIGVAPLLFKAIAIAYVVVCKYVHSEIYDALGYLSTDDFMIVVNSTKGWLSTFAPQNDETDKFLSDSFIAVCRCAIDLISPSIYTIAIMGYPEAAESIKTLRLCFAKTNNYGREALLNKLIDLVRSRLLNVEEDTSVILDGYANCVHSLKELDPSCSFMYRVCGEIREFLKKRPDTVRKIINYITSEKREQLAEHLGAKSGTIIDEEEFKGCNDEFLPEALGSLGWDKWVPDPPDAPDGKSSHVRESADVFNMLISVYGSKEMFVKEYRKLLAERLTSFVDKDSLFELRYLDVLKQRFNDGELAQCEVMLKDDDESRRVNITVSEKQSVPITASIISSHFWPLPEFDKSMELPSTLDEGLNFYAKVYEKSKPTRRLNWLKSWGWTEVEITLGKATVTRCVSNQHAAVLYLYADKESWTPSDVATRLGITKSVARRRLEWWESQGLLIQELPNGATSEVWSLSETSATLESNSRQAADVSDDEDSATIEDVTDAADALEAYWIYTRNYIAQNESVKAERIHKIFKMFSSPSAQSPSLDVVNTFLFRKVKQNLLTFQSGSFRVVKDPTKP